MVDLWWVWRGERGWWDGGTCQVDAETAGGSNGHKVVMIKFPGAESGREDDMEPRGPVTWTICTRGPGKWWQTCKH